MSGRTLRITKELDSLLKQTAAHCGIGESAVVRAVAVGIERGRIVEEIKIEKSLYKSGEAVKNFAFPLPVSGGEFRRVLAIRCHAELAKPGKIKRSFNSVAGIDYVVEGME